MRERRRPSGSDTLASFADSGLDPQAAQRQRDIDALKHLTDCTGLRLDEAESFCDMLERLERGKYPLTDKQRAWVLSRCEDLGIDAGQTSPAERNANVPRGREVRTPPVLQSLPKAPPGRGSGYGAGASRALSQDQRNGPSKPARVKTQLERARVIVEELLPHGELNPARVEELRDLFARAQNPPPEGVSDGSFSTREWDALRVLLDLLPDVERYAAIVTGRDPNPQLRGPLESSFPDDPVDMDGDDIPF